MVEEAFVSFETAKLLKDRGFNERCFAYYTLNGFLSNEIKIDAKYNVGEDMYSAPTQQMACRWLREVHKVHIRIIEDITGTSFEWQVYQNGYCKRYGFEQPTYEAAVEQAIKYALEKLI